VQEGGEFIINGQKVWTTSAQYADYGFILTRTDPDAPKHRGITFMLVDMRQPGIQVRPLLTMKEDRHFNEVFFTNARTSIDNVVNGVNEGWAVGKFVLMNEGQSIGTTTGSNRAADLARSAVDAGRFNDPIVRERLGATYVEERVLDLLQDRLRSAILDGRRPDVDGSVLKLFYSESSHRKAETALWLQGSSALLTHHDAPGDGRWQSSLLSRSALTVGGGSSEVHRNGLGERALGLPSEPRLDRNQPFKDLKISGE
jgi:alkylation response protein AidB-like acyl-CoA dehydrogenase